MVLRNWYNVMKVLRSQQTIEKGVTIHSGDKNDVYYNAGSAINQLTLCPDKGLGLSVQPDNQYAYILLGRGTTPATVDDYKLEDMITSGLSCSVATTVDEDNDAVYKLTITNTSGADITIGEIGMISPFYYSSGSSGRRQALKERTVLDSPITIPAGGIGLIDYSIKLPIPTA